MLKEQVTKVLLSSSPGREHSLGKSLEEGQCCHELLPVDGRGGEGGRWGGYRWRLKPSESLSYPLGRDLLALCPGLAWVGEAGCQPRTCQSPPALPSSLRFFPKARGRGDDSGAGALGCILIQHQRLPAARISRALSSSCSLEREVGEIIVSPWEEIWAQAAASLSALGEEMPTQHPEGVGWGVGREECLTLSF